MPVALLAFDTSTETLAIALEGPRGLDVHEGPGGALASTQLLPRVQAMLAAQGLRTADLAAIAFGCGPGAFTGLRTACSVAQGLAFGAGRPVLPIDSLLIVAEDAAPDGAPPRADADVGVVMDARMGEVYAARYARRAHGDWTVCQAPGLWSPEALQSAWHGQPPALLAGHGAGLVPGLAARAAGVTAACQGRAAALMRLAGRAWAQGLAVDPDQALPTYLRDKVALTTAERLQAEALR